MTVISLPSSPANFAVASWRTVNKTARNESGWTGAGQFSETEYKRHECELELPRMELSTAQTWEAWVTKMEGGVNTTELFHPDHTSPQGTGNGTPVVDSIDSASDTLTTSGWTAGEKVLKAGDYIEVDTSWKELKIVQSDVTADSNGDATIEIWPPFRNDPSGSESIVTDTPRGEFYLPSDEINFESDDEKTFQVTIPFVERVA